MQTARGFYSNICNSETGEIAKRFDDRIVVLDGHNQVNIIHQKIVKELSRRKII